jgi:hypothetical protein
MSRSEECYRACVSNCFWCRYSKRGGLVRLGLSCHQKKKCQNHRRMREFQTKISNYINERHMLSIFCPQNRKKWNDQGLQKVTDARYLKLQHSTVSWRHVTAIDTGEIRYSHLNADYPAIDKILIFFLLLSGTLHVTQYTHYSLKHMLPQHCSTYNDAFLLINSTKV